MTRTLFGGSDSLGNLVQDQGRHFFLCLEKFKSCFALALCCMKDWLILSVFADLPVKTGSATRSLVEPRQTHSPFHRHCCSTHDAILKAYACSVTIIPLLRALDKIKRLSHVSVRKTFLHPVLELNVIIFIRIAHIKGFWIIIRESAQSATKLASIDASSSVFISAHLFSTYVFPDSSKTFAAPARMCSGLSQIRSSCLAHVGLLR